MNKCINCYSLLKEGAKFCTYCGTPIEDKNRSAKANDTFYKVEENKPKVSSKGPKIIVGLIAVVALFFIVKSLVTNIDISRNSLSISKILTKIEGEWHDPTGVLLGDKDEVITFRKRGDVVIGEDKNKVLYIQLLPYSSKNFSGLVVLDGNDDDFLVDFYKKENKLVFFSTLTKTSWYLMKIE